MSKIVLILSLCIFMLVKFDGFSQQKKGGDAIWDYWYTENNKSVIKVYRAKNGKYYGKINSLKDPLEEDGSIKVDDDNPDPAKRNVPLIGLMILKGFDYEGDNTWSGGTIYDPENGKTYKCTMWLNDPDKLDVRGYIGFSLLGRTTTWVRKKD